MSEPKIRNVLFLCTQNSARSIIAECLLNRLGGGKWRGFSAGSRPRGEAHPLALEVLQAHGCDVSGVRSKSWDEFAGPDAPNMDVVITVCDNAAQEACPVWPGHPLTAHWGLPDPAKVECDEDKRCGAFEQTLHDMTQHISSLVSLPVDELDGPSLRDRLREIGTPTGTSRQGVTST